MTTDPSEAGREPAPVHHPTQDEMAVEVWDDESPAPEPEGESTDTAAGDS